MHSLKIKHGILLLAGVAWLARIGLACQGGQLALGDEVRYLRGTQLYLAFVNGQWEEARWLLSQPDHQVFTWLGALLAPLQHLLGMLAGHDNPGDLVNLAPALALGAALLSLASAAMIVVIFHLARAAGASDAAAGWAAVLVAGSNTLFYLSRHLLPYDPALLVWLLALLASCGSRRRNWILAGLCAAFTFYLYNGYWFLVPLAALWQGWRHRSIPATGWWLAGASAVVLVTGLVGFLTGGVYYWRFLIWFSGTVNQGIFSEGWSLPWEYLWHAEGLAGVALAVLCLVALVVHRRRMPGYVGAALAAILLGYGLLVLCSVGLEKFVVYGRMVRPLVPLFCLAAGWAVATLLPARPLVHGLALAGMALVMIPAQARHFHRIYAREVEARVLAQFGNPKRCVSMAGTMFQEKHRPVTRPDLALVNATGLYPLRQPAGVPPGRVLLRWPHPVEYLPYQYEGYTPRERALLRAHDISIRLIALADPASVPDFPPREQFMDPAALPDGHDHDQK